MIYWYSGTGNTRYAASYIATATGDDRDLFMRRGSRLSHITMLQKTGKLPMPQPPENPVDSKEVSGFFCPVYSWGIPPVVLYWIRNCLDAEAARGTYIYAVLTCGDETGRAPQMLRKALARRGLSLDAIWSVQMPNDYVLLPGFSVDDPQLAQRKLEAAPKRLDEIAAQIRGQVRTEDCVEGPAAWLKTGMVYPLFRRWGTSFGHWKIDRDKCICCGRCVSVCPVDNITMEEARTDDKIQTIYRGDGNNCGLIRAAYPMWGKKCISCCACYNACPEHIIEFRRFTRGKGQYYCPF